MHGFEDNGNFEAAASAKSLLRIGEVSRLTATKPFVLRYWETEFPMLQPAKSPKGHRLYRRDDIETVFTIKRLLYDEGFTIAGARRHLRDQAHGTNGANASANASADAGPIDAVTDMRGAETALQAISAQAAMLNRKTLLDLRDSLRSLLTALESQ